MVYCDSEINQLQKLIVHRPNPGIGRISPKRAEELLFDDIVYYPDMQQEHEIYCRVLEKFIGIDNVLFTEDLLVEALDSNPTLQLQMIEEVVDFEELPSRFISVLKDLDNQTLSETLISGYLKDRDFILFDPIPNFIFTRDIGVTIKDHILITKAAKKARFRENFLTQFIFKAHPLFETERSHDRIINMNDVEQFSPNQYGEKISIEGGDVMMLNPEYLLVGCSERTTEHAIRCLSETLFAKDLVSNVVMFNIPSDRSYMHIDTIFTVINRRDVACYKPLVYDGLSSHVICLKREENDTFYYSLKDFLYHELDEDINFIFSGNGKTPYQEREQWTDGCNLLVIKPGVAIAYGRNIKTQDAFRAHGYNCIHALDLLKMDDVSNLENTIINLPSAELSRARGGSHCMSFPILREKS